jgi:hypothetical protein
MACGVNKRPQEPSGPERQRQVNRKTDDHRRQAHQRVEHDDRCFAAGKPRQREKSAGWYANERGQQHGAQADQERQPDNGE